MSRTQPPFHDLEFARDLDFWTGTPSAPRCALLMPVRATTEFLAFGVIQASKQVQFVARGKLKVHLPTFITRMAEGKAHVELYVRAPVPESLIKRYASGPPIEGQESEDPPDQPVVGFAPTGSTPYSASRTMHLWSESAPASRRVLLTPTHEPAEFLALGLLTDSGREFFRLTGSVQEHLGEFVTRMAADGAHIELYAQLPAL